MPRPVYQIIQQIMDERDLKIADVAKLSKLPDSTVRGIIKRKQMSIALDVAFKLSDGLNVSLEYLADRKERRVPISQFKDEHLNDIMKSYDSMNKEGRDEIYKIVKNYASLPCYQKETQLGLDQGA